MMGGELACIWPSVPLSKILHNANLSANRGISRGCIDGPKNVKNVLAT